MAKRCCDTHFYVGGHKTRSGNARYAAPDGTELAVVCGRNRPGPGEIHLRDVPDHSMLRVTGHGGELFLTLDQATSRGHKGRIDIYELPLGERDQRAVALNNLMELPDHHADHRWASRTVGFWIENGEVEKTRAPGPGSAGHGDVVLRTNAHRYVTQLDWGRFLYLSFAAQDVTRAHMTRVCGRLCGMDPAADRRAFDTALRELSVLMPVVRGGVPPEYFDRLAALLADQAPHIGLGPLRRVVNSMQPEYAFDLVARMAGTRGVVNAATTRALGSALMGELLAKTNLTPSDRSLIGVGILANDRLAPWHKQIIASTDALPDALVPAAYRLACPAAAELLADRRAAAMTSRPTDAKRRAAPGSWSTQDIVWQKGFSEKLPATTADAVPVTNPLPHGARVVRSQRVTQQERITLREWDAQLLTKIPVIRWVPSVNRIYEYLDVGVQSFDQIAALSRYGIDAGNLGALEDAGARTTAQKIACSTHGMYSGSLRKYTAAGVAEFSDALQLARHNVQPEWLPLFAELGVTDHAVMRRLGDLDVSPAGLAAFGLAGRTIDEVMQSAARGVPGPLCLALSAAGVDDPDVQARVCRNDLGYVEAMVSTGLLGPDLAAGIDAQLGWGTATSVVVEQQVPMRDVLEALAAGITDPVILEYTAAGVRSVNGWKTLIAHNISAEKADFLVGAGISDPSDMVAFANAPIDSVEAARAYVATRSPKSVSAASTAAAMVG